MPWPEHVVHRIGEALCAHAAVRIVCGVHTAEAKAVEAGPVFYARCVCCHHAHLRIKTTRSGVIRPREAAISWKSVTRRLCHTTGRQVMFAKCENAYLRVALREEISRLVTHFLLLVAIVWRSMTLYYN